MTPSPIGDAEKDACILELGTFQLEADNNKVFITKEKKCNMPCGGIKYQNVYLSYSMHLKDLRYHENMYGGRMKFY